MQGRNPLFLLPKSDHESLFSKHQMVPRPPPKKEARGGYISSSLQLLWGNWKWSPSDWKLGWEQRDSFLTRWYPSLRGEEPLRERAPKARVCCGGWFLHSRLDGWNSPVFSALLKQGPSAVSLILSLDKLELSFLRYNLPSTLSRGGGVVWDSCAWGTHPRRTTQEWSIWGRRFVRAVSV